MYLYSASYRAGPTAIAPLQCDHCKQHMGDTNLYQDKKMYDDQLKNTSGINVLHVAYFKLNIAEIKIIQKP